MYLWYSFHCSTMSHSKMARLIRKPTFSKLATKTLATFLASAISQQQVEL
jgi:hypothetical protein